MASLNKTLPTSSEFKADTFGADCGLAWYVVRTNPRCERRAEASLAEAGFETYAPVFRKLIIHHRSKKLLARDFPLLTGYLFVRLDDRRPPFGTVRSCDGVQGLLGVNGTPAPITDDHVAMVREIEGAEWLRVDMALRQWWAIPKAQRKGKRVVDFIGGPLAGFMGYTADTKARGLARVITSVFGATMEINVPVDDLCAAA